MQRTLLKVALASALAGFTLSASAQFSGAFAPGNWTVAHSPDATTDSGSVDASLAPASITLIGSDNLSGNPSRLDFTIVAPTAGSYSFDWLYHTNDAGDPTTNPPTPPANFDWVGYSINGNHYQLSDLAGAVTQSGHQSFSVASGAKIGFYVETQDNFGGSATLTVSNFSAPVPEPAAMLLMAIGLAGLALVHKRRAD